MARPRTAAGELGAVQLTRLASGTWWARARMRDDAGALVQLRADGATEDVARTELLARGAALATHTKALVTGSSTIAEAAAVWLPTVRLRAEAGMLSWSTYENYEVDVSLVVVPTCGGVSLEALTVGHCDRILQHLLAERGVSAARKARSVLSLICGFAVRDDAIRTNPVRDVTRLPTPQKKTAILTPEQIIVIRELMTHWREDDGMGPRPNWRALVDGMDIMLGTSARIGECIGLRRCDVDMTMAPATVLIDGTIVQNRVQGVTRKDAPQADPPAPPSRPPRPRRGRGPAPARIGRQRTGSAAIPDEDEQTDERVELRAAAALLHRGQRRRPLAGRRRGRRIHDAHLPPYRRHLHRTRGRTHDCVPTPRTRERDGHPLELRRHGRAS